MTQLCFQNHSEEMESLYIVIMVIIKDIFKIALPGFLGFKYKYKLW